MNITRYGEIKDEEAMVAQQMATEATIEAKRIATEDPARAEKLLAKAEKFQAESNALYAAREETESKKESQNYLAFAALTVGAYLMFK